VEEHSENIAKCDGADFEMRMVEEKTCLANDVGISSYDVRKSSSAFWMNLISSA
jgi:hypothetical protein